jgi:hypothetical protein
MDKVEIVDFATMIVIAVMKIFVRELRVATNAQCQRIVAATPNTPVTIILAHTTTMVVRLSFHMHTRTCT